MLCRVGAALPGAAGSPALHPYLPARPLAKLNILWYAVNMPLNSRIDILFYYIIISQNHVVVNIILFEKIY